MTNISIEKSLSVGIYILVKDEEGNFQIFSPFKDKYGYWRSGGWTDTKEEAEQNIGSLGGYSENLDDFAKAQGWEAEVYTPKHDKLKVGDKVVVLETTGEAEEIKEVLESYRVPIYLLKDGYYHRNHIAPVLEEAKEMTVAEVSKALGYEVKIIK